MRSASSQRWRRRYKFTARRRERSRECSRVHQYNSLCAVVYKWSEWRSAAPLAVDFSSNNLNLGCFAFFPRNEKEKGNRTPRYFLDALFDAEDGKTNARMNAEIKRERERESYFLSLVILSSSVVFRCISSLFDCMICTRIPSQFHFSHAHETPKGKI